MYINAIEYLLRELEKIDANIKHLECSPNRAFILIESGTLSSFHWFNLCFKHFWIEEFDKKSASQLMLFQKIIKTHSELSGRYTSLFQEQIDYLKNILTINKKSSKDLNPVFFGEEKNKDIINYYEEQLKNELDIEGNPLYKIDVARNIYYEDDEKKSPALDFYTFRSDSINETYFKGLLGIYYCLKTIFKLMSVVCSYPEEIISGYKPNQEDILSALESELRIYAKEVSKRVERDLKKIAQRLKPNRNEPLTPDVWGLVMKEEDEMFEQAIYTQVGEIEDKYIENISATKDKLIDNYSLLEKIKTTCIDDELFDIRLSVETHQLLTSLNTDNLDLFYELVLRRNIIHCEMFPELKSQYEEWLNKVNEQADEVEEDEMSAARQSKLNEIIRIMQNGDWKAPATAENVTLLLNTIFGRDVSLLEDGDEQLCEIMWTLVEGGSGNRMEVVPANLAGFFLEENLLNGSPKTVSNDLFGKSNNQSNNINKGNSSRCSNAFSEVITFLTKYTNKIIRKV